MQAQDKYSIFVALQSTPKNLKQSPTCDNQSPACQTTESQSRGKLQEQVHSQDYRLSPIELTSFTMYYKGMFVTPKPEIVDLGVGVVHLFKGAPDEKMIARYRELSSPLDEYEDVLAILAVPSYLSSSDFMGYIGNSVRRISHLRMIRTADLSRYMVLIKFRTSAYAADFRQNFNGASFNAMEPETVHCVPVALILFDDQVASAHRFPELSAHSDSDRIASHKINYKPKPPTTANLTELPTCVVCLERMDSSVTGLLTILCEHTFHCSCISKWVNTHPQCPICRHSMARDIIESSEKNCATCLSSKNLWMCLICGNIACGRYESQHAIQHFETFGHCFAMDLDSGRIWDYSSDSYVHRLVQEKLEAKPSASKQSLWEKDDIADEISEFEELLATQLESQRMYYEGQVRAAVAKAAKSTEKEQQTTQQILSVQTELSSLEVALKEKSREVAEQTELLKRAEAKMNTLSNIARKVEGQYKEELSMNASLMLRLTFLEKKEAESTAAKKQIESEMVEVKEQLRDIMIHLSGSKQVQELQELHEGQVVVVPTQKPDEAGTSRKPRKAKNKKRS